MDKGQIKNFEHRFKNLDLDGVIEYFEEHGAIEVISMLDSTGYRLGELDDELDVSRSYINDRIGEGAGLGLITDDIRDGHRVYKLTQLGDVFREQMRSINLVSTHEELRASRNNFETKKDEFEDWANKSDITDKFEDKLNSMKKRAAGEAMGRDRDARW